MVAVVILFLGNFNPAGAFEFVKIADKNTSIPDGAGAFTGFASTTNIWKMVPTIDDKRVAFVGYGNGTTLRTGRFVTKQIGIYQGDGGDLRKVVDLSTTMPGCDGDFNAFYPPSLAAEHAAFRVTTTEGEQGLFRASGNDLAAIACTGEGGTEAPEYPVPGSWFETFGEPTVDRHGSVVFNGGTNLDPQFVPYGLYKSVLGSTDLKVIADRRLAADPVFVSFKFGSTFKIASIVDDLTAFLADIKLYPGDLCGSCLEGFGAKMGAIWLFDGEGIEQIVSYNTKPPGAPNYIRELSVPDSDGAGFVAFWANASDDRYHEGIYRYYRGELRKIVDFETIIPGTERKFASFTSNGNSPAYRPISVRGDIVAFQGAPDLTLFNVGIYVWVAGELVKLIAPGDELGDQMVVKTYLGYEAVSRRSIAFMVLLRNPDGSQEHKVFRADLVPGNTEEPPAGLLDVTGNGSADLETDGLLIMRRLFGFDGETLAAGALEPGAMRTDPSAISDHIDQNASWLDVDGNGKADALTDGLLIMRFLSGDRGDALLRNVVASNANRTSADDVESHIFALLP